MTEETAAEYWENRYRDGKTWSGKPNAALVRELAGESPGTALDLGSGEGGDALWLAREGWSVTAVDISPSALAIGAAEQGADDDITWVAADLSEWRAPRTFDLVSACFLHSTVELPREAILRRNAEAVTPGGQLLIVGHFSSPHHDSPHHDMELPSPQEVLAMLFDDNPRLSREGWTVETCELVERQGAAPDGTPTALVDSVLRLRRVS